MASNPVAVTIEVLKPAEKVWFEHICIFLYVRKQGNCFFCISLVSMFQNEFRKPQAGKYILKAWWGKWNIILKDFAWYYNYL